MIYVRLDRNIVTVTSEEVWEEEPNPEVRWASLNELLEREPTEKDIEKLKVGYTYNERRKAFTAPPDPRTRSLPTTQE